MMEKGVAFRYRGGGVTTCNCLGFTSGNWLASLPRQRHGFET